MTEAEITLPTPRPRLVSLDQFRGYTVAGMFLVNYLGSFAVTPALLKHHNTYCSYADTIMPQFLFAVGFAFRLTFGRRVAADGARTAYWHACRRIAGLVALAIVLYTLGSFGSTWHRLTEGDLLTALGELFKRQWFQTLLHIAVTSLWILPVIRAGVAVRAAFLIASAAAHVALSAWFNFVWVNTPPNGIDGGPLGFLTWTIPAIIGTFACDAVMKKDGGLRLDNMLAGAFALMLVGYLLSCGTRLHDTERFGIQELTPPPKLAASPVLVPRGALEGRRHTEDFVAEPPFVPPPSQRQWNYWMMSQRSGSVSYLTFTAGFSLAVFVLFYLACDRYGWQLGVLRTLGVNALTGYVLHGALEEAVKPWIPRDADWWHVAAGFGVTFGTTYLVLWVMEKKKVFIRM